MFVLHSDSDDDEDYTDDDGIVSFVMRLALAIVVISFFL